MPGLPDRVSHAQKAGLLREGLGSTMLWASHLEPFSYHRRVLLRGRKTAAARAPAEGHVPACLAPWILLAPWQENLLVPAARSCAQTCTLTCLAARSQVGLTCSRIGVRAGRPGRKDLSRGTPPSMAAAAHARDSLRGPLCPGSGATQPRAAAAAGAPAGLLPLL